MKLKSIVEVISIFLKDMIILIVKDFETSIGEKLVTLGTIKG